MDRLTQIPFLADHQGAFLLQKYQSIKTQKVERIVFGSNSRRKIYSAMDCRAFYTNHELDATFVKTGFLKIIVKDCAVVFIDSLWEARFGLDYERLLSLRVFWLTIVAQEKLSVLKSFGPVSRVFSSSFIQSSIVG